MTRTATLPPMAARVSEEQIPFSALAKPVTVRGTIYPSQSAAARALGVTQGAVWRALQIGPAALDALGGRKSNRRRPCAIDGTTYASAAAAARATGINYSAALSIADDGGAK